MRNVVVIGAACAVVVVACGKGDGGRTGEDVGRAPEAARPAQLIFPEAERAETLLKSAGVPMENRSDLTREFPEGCVWHAAYSSTGAEVILEAYAFEDDGRARQFGAERNAELLAMDVLREFAVATNGPLVLVAYYDPTEDAGGKKEALTKFVAAFAGEG
jgi:hypothetical protein